MQEEIRKHIMAAGGEILQRVWSENKELSFGEATVLAVEKVAMEAGKLVHEMKRHRGETGMLERICEALGWQGGTIHQVVEEIRRLRAVEKKARSRLETRVDTGDGSTFCAFCYSSGDHRQDCVHFLLQDN